MNIEDAIAFAEGFAENLEQASEYPDDHGNLRHCPYCGAREGRDRWGYVQSVGEPSVARRDAAALRLLVGALQHKAAP